MAFPTTSRYNFEDRGLATEAPAPAFTDLGALETVTQTTAFTDLARNSRFNTPARFFPDSRYLQFAPTNYIPPHWAYQGNNKTYPPMHLTDYNDPYAINSLADALLNTEGLRRRYGDWATKPILRQTVAPLLAIGDILWNQTIKPVVSNVAYGAEQNGLGGALSGLGTGVKQAGLNLLVNLGETLDVAANPVKATIIESLYNMGIDYGSKTQGNVLRGVGNTLGIGSGGRTNYDWDTGNGFIDLALEIATDPLNWISFGAAGTGKAAMATLAKEALPEAMEGSARKIAKAFTRAAYNSSDDLSVLAAKFFAQNDPSSWARTGKLFKNTPMLNDLLGKTLSPGEAAKFTDDVIKALSDQTVRSARTFKGARGVYNFVNEIEAALFKGAMLSSGAGELFAGGKAAYKNVIAPYLVKVNAEGLMRTADTLAEFAYMITKDDLAEPLKPYQELFKSLDLDKSFDEFTAKDLTSFREFVKQISSFAAIYQDPLITELAETARKAYTHAALPLDPVSKFIYRQITPLYKTGYLSSVGFPIRNTIDGIIKNAIEMGGLANIPKSIDDFIKAFSDFKSYNEIMQRMIQFAREIEEFSINGEVISRFFQKYPELDEDAWRLFHAAMRDDRKILGGITAELKEQMRLISTKERALEIADDAFSDPEIFAGLVDSLAILRAQPDAMERSLNLTMVANTLIRNTDVENFKAAYQLLDDLDMFTQFAKDPYDMEAFFAYLQALKNGGSRPTLLGKFMEHNPVMNANEAIERNLRWSMYQEQRALGRTHNEAVQSIISTHFLYDNAPFAERFVEAYFPFTGFTLKNYDYWSKVGTNVPTQQFADDVYKALKADYPKWLSISKAVEDFRLPKGRLTAGDKLAIEAFQEAYTPMLRMSETRQFIAHMKQFQKYVNEPLSEKAFRTYIRSLYMTRGGVLGDLMNVMTPLLNLDETSDNRPIDYDTLEKPAPFSMAQEYPDRFLSQSQLFQILNGNMIFGEPYADASDPRGYRYLQNVLKLNPSWMDALNFTIDPVGSVSNRLLPLFSEPISYALRDKDSEYTKSNQQYLLDTLPIIGTAMQRYSPVRNRYESSANPLYAFPSVLGTAIVYPATERTEYVPSEKSIAERKLGQEYYKWKTTGEPGPSPYERFPGLAAAARVAQRERYGTFDPNNINPEAPQAAINFWYAEYKEQKLPYEFNPFQYYPQYQIGTGYNTYKHSPNPRSIAQSREYNHFKSLYSVDDPRTYVRRNLQYRLNRMARPHNFYKDLYTDSGHSRIAMRMGRVTGRNLQYRMNDIKHLFKIYYRQF